jgi:hypothetical protein
MGRGDFVLGLGKLKSHETETVAVDSSAESIVVDIGSYLTVGQPAEVPGVAAIAAWQEERSRMARVLDDDGPVVNIGSAAGMAEPCGHIETAAEEYGRSGEGKWWGLARCLEEDGLVHSLAAGRAAETDTGLELAESFVAVGEEALDRRRHSVAEGHLVVVVVVLRKLGTDYRLAALEVAAERTAGSQLDVLWEIVQQQSFPCKWTDGADVVMALALAGWHIARRQTIYCSRAVEFHSDRPTARRVRGVPEEQVVVDSCSGVAAGQQTDSGHLLNQAWEDTGLDYTLPSAAAAAAVVVVVLVVVAVAAAAGEGSIAAGAPEHRSVGRRMLRLQAAGTGPEVEMAAGCSCREGGGGRREPTMPVESGSRPG